jgi:hypothetical protein
VRRAQRDNGVADIRPNACAARVQARSWNRGCFFSWVRENISERVREKIMDELEKRIEELQEKGEQWVGGGLIDRRMVPGIILLAKATVRLDKSSTFLARVNIALGGIVIIIGILEVVIMLRGH